MKFEDVTWKIKKINSFQGEEPWLDALSRLRGEMLYENGRRPSFKLENGEFYDRDDFDITSHHVLAYDKQKLIGAIRLLPLRPPFYHCISSQVAGEKKFISLVQQQFSPSQKILEVNRLVADAEYHSLKLAPFICAAGWVIAKHFNYHIVFNGNKALTDSFYTKHVGGRYFPQDAGPYISTFYSDNEIYLLYVNEERMSPYFSNCIATMESIPAIQEAISETEFVE